MSKVNEKYGKWILTYRWWILILTSISFLVTANGMSYLHFDNDSRIYLGKGNPQLQALETIEKTYTKNSNVFFIIAPQKGNVFTPETLTSIVELTEASWKIPYSSRVDSISNFQHTKVLGDDLIVEDLIQNPAKLSLSKISEIKKTALSEPLLVNKLISQSGHVTGINVTIIEPDNNTDISLEVSAFVRSIADEFRKKHPHIALYLTGSIMIDTAFGEASKADLTTLVPLMYLVFTVMLGIMLRSFVGTISVLIIMFFSMITALGLAGWFGISLNPTAANAPIVILTLAVSDSIHIIIIMLQQMRLGKTKYKAIEESLRVNLHPVFLTSITTLIGFLSMNFSESPPFRDMGNIVAIGVAAAFIYSILFLPSLLAVLPIRVKAKEKDSGYNFNIIATFVIERRNELFLSMLLLVVFLTIGSFRNELNDNFIKYFDDSYEFRRATDFLEENLTGFDIIEYSLDSGEAGGISNPGYLETVEKFANWYREQPKVVHVSSITDIMKRLNQNMHGDEAAYFRIPHQRDIASQYLLLYEMSLPFGLDLNDQINLDKSATRLVVRLKNMTARELREMDKKARHWLGKNAPEEMFTYGSGLSIVYAHLSERNIHSMLGASFGSLLLISGILILAMRSLTFGMVSLIPNMLPIFLTFGIWGVMVGEIGLSASVKFSCAIGIIVDDTIHFMSKYLFARRERGLGPHEAIRYAFNTVGAALLVTTIILVAGFLVLFHSGFKLNSDMGVMTAITLAVALLLDFIFLPIIIMKVEEKS